MQIKKMKGLKQKKGTFNGDPSEWWNYCSEG